MPARAALRALERAVRQHGDDAGCPPTRPAQVVCRETRDADEQASCLRNWDQVYEQLAPGGFEGRFTEVRLGRLQLFREVTNRALYQAGRVREGEQVLGVPVAMQGAGCCAGRPLGPDGIVSMRGGGTLDLCTPQDFDIVAAAMPVAALERYANEVEDCAPGRAGAGCAVLDLGSGPAQELRTLLRTALDVARLRPSALQITALHRTLEQALLASAARVLSRASDDLPSRAPARLRHALVARARDYMRAHVDEPLTIGDLCRALRVSRRTLQYSFQDVLQINPASYLRALRLNGARRALRAAQPGGDGVHDIAARWGFWHLSRFASDYRRMFGELPSQTLRAGGASPDAARAAARPR
ncbi:MAG: helix-turn-helix domain-containing protein [Burkholderiales bacterium]|nr:helix-turn-helix domain-containing protein [Burkholderiales bacterium]